MNSNDCVLMYDSLRPRTYRIFFVVIGFLPLFYWHIVSLLTRPHFQFLLLLPLALYYLGKTIEPASGRVRTTAGRTLGILLFTAAVSGGVYAAWVWSPWLGTICLLFAIAGSTIADIGLTNATRYSPIWLFAWVLVPPPFGLDEDLIVKLRNTTTSLTSAVLDHWNIYHQRAANIIELPGKPLFIADACSGIHSLYVLLAAAFFLSRLKRRSFVHTTLLLAATFFLVLIENVSRIVIVAVGIGFRRDLSSGLDHTILGLLLFACSMLLVVSMDQLLLFATPRVPIFIEMKLDSLKRRWFSSTSKSASTIEAPKGINRSFLAASVVMALTCCLQLSLMPGLPPSVSAFVESGFDLPSLEKNALPSEVAGFTLKDFKTVDRVFGDPFGQASQQWTFQKGDLEVVISLDYPYDGLHDLCLCYSQIGWMIPDKEVLTSETIAARCSRTEEPPIAQATMNREFYGHGFLLFSLADRAGNTDARIKDLVRRDPSERIADRLRSVTQPNTSPVSSNLEPPLIQTQLFTRTFTPFTDEKKSSLLQLFCECRGLLRTRIEMLHSNLLQVEANTEGSK